MSDVLIVDDDPGVCQALARLLSAHELSAHCVSSGPDALPYLQLHKPSLIVLDYLMPAMTGLEVLKHIRAQQSLAQLPVIILASGVADTTVSELLSMGASEYLDKSETHLLPAVLGKYIKRDL